MIRLPASLWAAGGAVIASGAVAWFAFIGPLRADLRDARADLRQMTADYRQCAADLAGERFNASEALAESNRLNARQTALTLALEAEVQERRRIASERQTLTIERIIHADPDFAAVRVPDAVRDGLRDHARSVSASLRAGDPDRGAGNPDTAEPE